MPWLWSIIEVIKKTSHLGRVYVGLFKFYPSPDSVPNNCDLCNDNIMNAIVEYNRTLRTEIFDELHCQCKDDWEKNLNSGIDFYQNLYDFMLTTSIPPIPIGPADRWRGGWVWGSRSSTNPPIPNTGGRPTRVGLLPQPPRSQGP